MTNKCQQVTERQLKMNAKQTNEHKTYVYRVFQKFVPLFACAKTFDQNFAFT